MLYIKNENATLSGEWRSVITPDDIQFISAWDKVLPGLKKNFETALQIDPKDRLNWAVEKQYSIYRDGQFSNAPILLQDATTIGQHVEHVISIAKDNAVPYTEDVCLFLQWHDVSEAIAHAVLPTQGQSIARDLNRYTRYHNMSINGDVKDRIDQLATDVVFEGHKDKKSIVEAFERKDSPAAQIAYGVDKIAPTFECLDFLKRGYAPSSLNHFWKCWDDKLNSGTLHSAIVALSHDVLIPEKNILEQIHAIAPYKTQHNQSNIYVMSL